MDDSIEIVNWMRGKEMKYSLDTNVIKSHFKGDKFSDDTDSLFVG